MAARTRFDPRIHIGRPMVAATEFLYDGVDYRAGDVFPIEGLHRSKIQAMYGARRINFADAALAPQATKAPEPAAGLVKIEAQPGGYYLISAAWLDAPERVRGKAAAEARHLELNDAGEPETHHGFSLTAGENGWWQIGKEGIETPTLNVQGEEKARAAAAALRAGEQPEDSPIPAEWTPPEPLKVGDVVTVGEPESDLFQRQATVVSIDGDLASLKAFVGEGEAATLVETTVPLASLTLAADTTVNEGADDETHEDEDEEQTGQLGADSDGAGGPAAAAETNKGE